MAAAKSVAVLRVARRQRWQVADGRVVVESWRRSGEGLGEFARRHGIRPQRLSRWAQRLEEAEPPVQFHPVRLLEQEDDPRRKAEPLEIVLGDGCLVRVPAGFAAEDLKRVLSVLAVGSGC
jgi:hypothetical protein